MTKLAIDYLGGVNYVETIVKHHPEGFSAGFLCKASGWKNGIRAARALAQTGKCPVMRVHGLWLDNHSFTEAHIKIAVAQAKKVAKLKEKYPELKLYYSPFLEPGSNQHPTPIKLLRQVKRACKNVLPKEIKVVTGRQMPHGISECHGTSGPLSGKYIYSYDGTDILENANERLLDRHKRAIACFAWTSLANGKKHADERISREDRVERGLWLKKKQIVQMADLLRGC